MYWIHLDASQREVVNDFYSRLNEAGWNGEPLESMLRNGINVSPEGNASYERERTTLVMEYDAETDRFTLVIDDRKEEALIRLHFECREHYSEVLSWVIRYQNELALHTFSRLLMEITSVCTNVFIEDEDGSLRKIVREDSSEGR